MLRGAVLAGGQSSRMGRDKALLELDGITLLERAVTLLQQSGAARVMVSGRPDHALGVPDLLPRCGPPGAVLALLSWLEQRGELDGQPLLLIPVDMPLLNPVVLQPLIDTAAVAGSCYYAPQIFPCIVPASSALLDHVKQLFAETQSPGGPRSMRALFAFLGSRALLANDLQQPLLVNVNTPEDWRNLEFNGR